jgi:hypothetical protein
MWDRINASEIVVDVPWPEHAFAMKNYMDAIAKMECMIVLPDLIPSFLLFSDPTTYVKTLPEALTRSLWEEL